MIMCVFVVEGEVYMMDEGFLGVDGVGINGVVEGMNGGKKKGKNEDGKW
ncbi:hypothetical protein [Bacillus pumilus]|nr:hypothetical protein [Bacillus pumilus]